MLALSTVRSTVKEPEKTLVMPNMIFKAVSSSREQKQAEHGLDEK